MALSKRITLTNTNENEVFIDVLRVDDVKKQVKTDMKNIMQDIQKIQKAYKKLAEDSKTKGTYKTTANSIVKNCKTYRSKLSSVSTTLENKVDKAVLDYVMVLISEMKQAEKSAEFNTNVE